MVKIDKRAVFALWVAKETQLGRRITVKEVFGATGINLEALAALRAGRATRFDAKVIDRFCAFFDVPPGPVPFLIYTPEPVKARRKGVK